MAKSSNQKLKLIYLARILQEKTDEEHGLTMQQLIDELARYDVKAERKSIYDDIHALQEYGLDIIGPQGREREYVLASRLFDTDEVKLLVDAVHASKFLSEAKTRTLVGKLKTLCSKHGAQSLQRQVIVSNRVKSMNAKMQYNIDPIHMAIAQNAQISFLFM